MSTVVATHRPRRFYAYRTCEACGYTYMPTSDDERVCRLCHTEAVYRAKPGGGCEQCGGPLPAGSTATKYCSDACRVGGKRDKDARRYDARRVVRDARKCEVCGEMFTPTNPNQTKACSDAECQHERRLRRRRVRQPQYRQELVDKTSML